MLFFILTDNLCVGEQHFWESGEHNRMVRSSFQHYRFNKWAPSSHHVDWKYKGIYNVIFEYFNFNVNVRNIYNTYIYSYKLNINVRTYIHIYIYFKLIENA